MALGLCPFAIGSDSIGNIRTPAGYCGIVGIKPTFSRVSNFKCWKQGFLEAFLNIGVLGCCVSDTALVLRLLSGHDENDELSLEQPEFPTIDFNNFQIKNIKFGVYSDYLKVF